MLGERRSWKNWPRVRANAHGVVISGRCATVGGWLNAQSLLPILFVLAGLVLLAAGFQPMWWDSVEGTQLYAYGRRLLWLRWALSELLVVRLPELGRLLNYEPRSIDWHLAIVGFVLIVARRQFAMAVGGLLSAVLMTRFKITITPERITARAGFRRVNMIRDDAQDVAVRLVIAEDYFLGRVADRVKQQALGDQPPAVVEIISGFNRRRLLIPRRTDRAEAIVARCAEALQETRQLVPDLI